MPKHVIDQKFFPEGVDRIPSCIADESIPTLDSILQKTGNQFYKLLDEQMVHEKLCWAETECSEDSLSHCPEETAPTVCSEFQASRLLLSHFGFLSFGDDQNPDEMTPMKQQSLTVLDTTKVSFANDLKTLDKMSPRTCDTAHIFYVRAGQCTEREIIENMSDENVSQIDPYFWQMLNSLGWNTKVKEHAGWTGQLENSWKIGTSSSGDDSDSSSPYNYNGGKNIIYWADVSSELAFVVPNYLNKEDNDSFDGQCLSTGSSGQESTHQGYERSYSEEKNKTGPGTKLATTKPRTLSLDLDKPQVTTHRSSEPVAPMRRRGTTNKPTIFGTMNTKIFLIWLESYEDYIKFPTEQLLPYTRTGEEAQTGIIPRAKDCHLIFLHPLNNGLIRIKLQGPSGRVNFATPLIDGMILSKRVVGNLIRQTCLNMSRRRRLDNDV